MFYVEFAPKERYERYIDWVVNGESGHQSFEDALFELTNLLYEDCTNNRLGEYSYRIIED